jgi:hypothetical protein
VAVQDYRKENSKEETPELAIKIKQVLHLLIKRKIILTFSKKNHEEIAESQAL